jgi:transposase InsO family protein
MLVDVHGVLPSVDLVNGWDRAPRDQTDVVSKHPLQLLLIELLQRPIEFTQYTSAAYQALLRANGFIVSMSRVGDCWDNAPVESFFAGLKAELLPARPWPTVDAAHVAIADHIETFYNRRRLHSALGYRIQQTSKPTTTWRYDSHTPSTKTTQGQIVR